MRHKNFRPPSVLLRPSRSDHSPWILKRGGLDSSGRRLISSIGKTKRIAIFSAKFFSSLKFSDFLKKKIISFDLKKKNYFHNLQNFWTFSNFGEVFFIDFFGFSNFSIFFPEGQNKPRPEAESLRRIGARSKARVAGCTF